MRVKNVPMSVGNVKHFPRFLWGATLLHHSLHKNVRDPNPCTPSTCDGDSLVAECRDVFSFGPDSTQHTSQCGGAGSLDVIIETQVILTVLVQQRLCHIARKIFKLNQYIRPSESDSFHELFNHVKVRVPTQTSFRHTQIKRILEQFFVVSPNIQHDREYAVGGYPSCRTVQRQFSNWNAHA